MADRQCPQCGTRFTFTKAHAPRENCCSRECHQAMKASQGRRQPKPAVRNDRNG